MRRERGVGSISILVLTPGGAQLDSILGKIHPERLALPESLFFIAARCDMASLEPADRVNLGLKRQSHLDVLYSRRLRTKAVQLIKTSVLEFEDKDTS